MEGGLRRYDPKARALLLSEVLPPSSRHFQLAYQIGLFDAQEAIDAIIRDAKLTAPRARRWSGSGSPITSPARC